MRFQYVALIEQIKDGDTFKVMIDKGMDDYQRATLRLYNVDCPEMNTDAGKKAKEFVRSIMPEGKTVFIKTYKDTQELYARYVVDVYFKPDYSGKSLSDLLIEQGLAVKKKYSLSNYKIYYDR